MKWYSSCIHSVFERITYSLNIYSYLQICEIEYSNNLIYIEDFIHIYFIMYLVTYERYTFVFFFFFALLRIILVP